MTDLLEARRPRAVVQLTDMYGRTPPAAVEAEMALLGSMILDPRIVDDVEGLVGPGDYYRPEHGAIHRALAAQRAAGHVDLVALVQLLRDQEVLEHVGGVEYLERLAGGVPSASGWEYYGKLVRAKARLRKLVQIAGEIVYEAYHEATADPGASEQVLERAQQMVVELGQSPGDAEPVDLATALQQEYDRIEAIEQGRGTGVPTGFPALDEIIGGLQRGEFAILAARPSMGKSALAHAIAEQVALGTSGPRGVRSSRQPVGVALFTLEMSRSAVMQRLLSSWSRVSTHAMRTGKVTQQGWASLLQACGELGQAPLHIDDRSSLTVAGLCAAARRLVLRQKVGLIVVDYLQLLTVGGRTESRQVEVASISRSLKSLARTLDVPVLAIAQLNRGPAERSDNRPRLSDLRESGSLEQDADLVMLLHREEYYHLGDAAWAQEHPEQIGLAEVIVAKQRNGPTGIARLRWDAESTRFASEAWAPKASAGSLPAGGWGDRDEE